MAMLTSVEDVLAEGKPYPPESEKDRIADYDRYMKAFTGNHEEIFTILSDPKQRSSTFMEKILQFMNKYVSPSVKTGLGVESNRRHLSVPTASIVGMTYSDLLFSKGINPKLSNEAVQNAVDVFMVESRFNRLNLEQSLLSSVLGDCVYEGFIRNDRLFFERVSPEQYFPISPEQNRLDIPIKIICRVETIDKNDALLHAKIYTRGDVAEGGQCKLEHRTYQLRNGKIGTRIESEKDVEDFPLSEIPVFHVANYSLGDVWGISDLGLGVDTLIEELDNRFSQNSAVLNRHGDPKMKGPTALVDPETNQVDLTSGYLPYREHGVEPEYMEWNAQLEHSFTQIEKIGIQISNATGLPVSLFLPDKTGRELSAKRLRLEFFHAVNRTSRKRQYFTPEIRGMLLMALQIGSGGKAVEEPLTDIGWQDGLPEDYKEAVDADNVRITNGTQSRLDSIRELDQLSEEDAQAKLKRIDEENEKDTERETRFIVGQKRNEEEEESEEENE